ncbi:Arginine--tRNA ligase, cytoplasmic [Camellia lanceoleosa]|uniref:Arginine--tRNA ligase, cytoplasmic n=1 Tax=Camellia lanceoleosa TaxID=1840588 RepID=A0ACC0HEE3_9ERIC|nr:Arginine--tRNA ligase, cytoplasmic [Camellia lanceoleosa]
MIKLSEISRHSIRHQSKDLDGDLEFKERAQQVVVSLQGGEEKYPRAWAHICEISGRGYQRVYQRLGIKIEKVLN